MVALEGMHICVGYGVMLHHAAMKSNDSHRMAVHVCECAHFVAASMDLRVSCCHVCGDECPFLRDRTPIRTQKNESRSQNERETLPR